MLIKVKQLMEEFVFKANQSNGDVPINPSAHLNEKSNARRMKNLKNNHHLRLAIDHFVKKISF